jgi:hypothetical protein
LNPRHKDFQSFALPTELRHRFSAVNSAGISNRQLRGAQKYGNLGSTQKSSGI